MGTSILNYTTTLQRDPPGLIGVLSARRGATISFYHARSCHRPLLLASFDLILDTRRLTRSNISAEGKEVGIGPSTNTCYLPRISSGPSLQPPLPEGKKTAPVCIGVQIGNLHMFI